MDDTPIFAWTAPQWVYPAFISISRSEVPYALRFAVRNDADVSNGEAPAEGRVVNALVPYAWVAALVHATPDALANTPAGVAFEDDDVGVSVRLQLNADYKWATWTLDTNGGNTTASCTLPFDVVEQMRDIFPVVVAVIDNAPAESQEPEAKIEPESQEPEAKIEPQEPAREQA